MGDPGAELAAARTRRAARAGLAQAHEGQRRGRREEGGGIECGDGASAEPREQPGPGQRRQQPEPFAQGLERGVAVGEQLAGQ